MRPRKRILIADDEPRVTRELRLRLEHSGRHGVREENRGEAVLAAARAFRPDVVLLDVTLSDLDGGSIAARRREDPVLGDTPIVFLTGALMHHEVGNDGCTIGGRTFLPKPAAPEQVAACIEQTPSAV